MIGRRGAGRSTVIAAALGLALLLGACSGNDDLPTGEGAVSGSATTTPTELRWRPAVDAVVCDGTERPIGTLEQASAGEVIEFASPLPVELAPGRADADGRYPLTWTCQPEEAQLRWELTATGLTSGRWVELTVLGAPLRDEDRRLTIALYGDEVVCDGLDHEVGVIGGLVPGEAVWMLSDHEGTVGTGQADAAGNQVFAWRCRPADVGQTWSVTAQAQPTERTVDFVLGGSAPDDDAPLALENTTTEVLCDGRRQVVATIANLFPGEVVTFAAPGVDDARDGQASGDGRLEVHWQCGPAEVGTSWEVTARGSETDKTVTISFTGVGVPARDAVARLVEDPFVCDGGRRPVAVVSELLEGEFVDFTSPQSGSLRDGRFVDGEVTVNWQCSAADLDGADAKVWEVTATGRQSARAVTFSFTGVRPG